VVSHGGVLDCVYRAANGMGLAPPRDFDVLNASINRLRWENNKLHIVSWSNTEHLLTSLDELGN
jgi:2,3-bisphosphoglycerate-dependent phosphoglycerate mutase